MIVTVRSVAPDMPRLSTCLPHLCSPSQADAALTNVLQAELEDVRQELENACVSL